MNLRRPLSLASTFAGLALLAGCRSSQPIVVGSGTLLVSGEVERELAPTTYNGALVPAPGAHVVIKLERSPGADGSATTVLSSDHPFEGFPLAYEVRGDASVLAERAAGARLLLQVRIYNHPGTESRVGDLVTESTHDVSVVGQSLDVKVSGLEACDAPNGGGFCASAR